MNLFPQLIFTLFTMEPTAFDCDEVLTNFLTDYLDENLDTGERKSFEEYLSQNQKEKEFASKAKKGKEVLAHFADKINIPSVTA